MDRSTLVFSAQNGDLDAFNQIVLAYQDRLFNIAVYMLKSEDCAADAVQNAFILAFRSLMNFRGGSFDFWLLRILKNVCYDELRRRKRQSTCPLEPLIDDEEEFDTPFWLTDPAQGPAELAERQELKQVIHAGLQTLSPEFRMVITLADIEGLDYAEVAATLSIPVGTVKSRLARARLRLRRELQHYAELLPYPLPVAAMLPETLPIG
jgi:RNA polymerase sigma-70 factor, ECF subfamily